LNDRTQGGGSIVDGSVELMVHRRMLESSQGVWLDEPGVDGKGLIVRGKHYLFFKSINESAKHFRDLSQRLYLEPILSFATYNSSDTDYRAKWVNNYSFINYNLPENVHLLTLENWKKNQVLLRLEHFYETADNTDLSKAIEVNIENLFKNFKINSITETTLAANELLSQSKRLQWNNEVFNPIIAKNYSISLTPQQIRTFILSIEDNLHPFSGKSLTKSLIFTSVKYIFYRKM
jgi:lysosomal alpha-mannosidase